MNKTTKRSAWKASLVQKTADLTGFSTDMVYKVINGDRDNELIMSTYMNLYEGENLLLAEVKKQIVFS